MKGVVVFFALLIASTSVLAKPTYQQARGVYDAMGKTIDESGIWYQKDRQSRFKRAREASALTKRSEAIFGADPLASPYRQCLHAATMHQQFVSNLNDLADAVEGIRNITDPFKLFSPFPDSTRFGDARALCFGEIETLR